MKLYLSVNHEIIPKSPRPQASGSLSVNCDTTYTQQVLCYTPSDQHVQLSQETVSAAEQVMHFKRFLTKQL